jgi:hypothetical protein
MAIAENTLGRRATLVEDEDGVMAGVPVPPARGHHHVDFRIVDVRFENF